MCLSCTCCRPASLLPPLRWHLNQHARCSVSTDYDYTNQVFLSALWGLWVVLGVATGGALAASLAVYAYRRHYKRRDRRCDADGAPRAADDEDLDADAIVRRAREVLAALGGAAAAVLARSTACRATVARSAGSARLARSRSSVRPPPVSFAWAHRCGSADAITSMRMPVFACRNLVLINLWQMQGQRDPAGRASAHSDGEWTVQEETLPGPRGLLITYRRRVRTRSGGLDALLEGQPSFTFLDSHGHRSEPSNALTVRAAAGTARPAMPMALSGRRAARHGAGAAATGAAPLRGGHEGSSAHAPLRVSKSWQAGAAGPCGRGEPDPMPGEGAHSSCEHASHSRPALQLDSVVASTSAAAVHDGPWPEAPLQPCDAAALQPPSRNALARNPSYAFNIAPSSSGVKLPLPPTCSAALLSETHMKLTATTAAPRSPCAARSEHAAGEGGDARAQRGVGGMCLRSEDELRELQALQGVLQALLQKLAAAKRVLDARERSSRTQGR
jgi:hypothetical protein